MPQPSENARPENRIETVAERTRAKLGELSPSERKVGRILLAAYPIAGLETVSELAKRAGVSAPTVLRFAARLGFGSYPAFQDALHREVHELLGAGPHLAPIPDCDGPQLTEAHGRYQETITATFSALPAAELERAAELLADPRLRVHLLAGRFGTCLADYLWNQLLLVRKDVLLIPENEPYRTSTLLDLGRRDTLIVFDFRRYDTAIVDYARRAQAGGAHIVLCTDPRMSPAAEVAEVVLSARIEGLTPFDSLVPACAVVEVLTAAVAERIGNPARARLHRIEAMRAFTEPTG
ncbi:MurR/RpiR family transcriptional regulator [Sciscionella marina]|uniref:MurR/RpiR family transcriptional regulator n=1 Tax=Sciscionella marina TaxID=508770 RepID=UPI00038240BC|nr:MurR/RpiR family transcriptional regulator [Sciscionella marina]